MRTKSLLFIVISIVSSNVPARAQTQIDLSAERGLELSPALWKRVAERMAQSPLRAEGDVTGPIVDRVAREWTIEAANCSLVKSQVKFTGVKKNTSWFSANNDGTFHWELRREASGAAVDAGGNKYLWIFNESSDLDLSDSNLTDTTKLTGYQTATLQLIALTPTGSGYTLAQYSKVDTPTLVSALPPPVASTGPPGCNPF